MLAININNFKFLANKTPTSIPFYRISPLFTPTPLQAKLFPCDDKYNDKEIADLQKSWAEITKTKILPFLGTLETEFARFYHKTMGRPIKYISLLIFLHILKEMDDMSDGKLIEFAQYDKRFEYAFELPYDQLKVSQKTLHNFRALLLSNGMARNIFDRANLFITKAFNLDTSTQRLDSTHIVSNMARLSRLGLFVRVIENFLNKLQKLDEESFKKLPCRFTERYAKRRGYFADARSNNTKVRLGEAANDMYYLIDRFSNHEKMSCLKVTELLKRVFNEHCTITKTEDISAVSVEVSEVILSDSTQSSEDVNADSVNSSTSTPANSKPSSEDVKEQSAQEAATEISPVRIKEPGEMPSRTLQNPSDEDVTCGYKGAGYEATFAETCDKKNPFQIITNVQTDPSDVSDQHKTVKAVDQLDANQMKPKVLHVDGGFTSGENIVECAERGVDLQGNLVGVDKEPDKLKLADFDFEPDAISIKACPAGQKPVAQRSENVRKPKAPSKQSHVVCFNLDTCKNCSLVDKCLVKLQKKKAVVRFSKAQLASSLRRRDQETKVFKERNKIRAGIEATNSEMKRSQGLARLRVRGQPRVDQTIIFKAMACNLKRMIKYVQSIEKNALKAEIGTYPAVNLAKC